MGATFFYFSHLLRNKIGVPGITGRPDNETPCPPQSEAASPVFPGPSLAAPGRTSCPPHHTQSGLTDDDGGAPPPHTRSGLTDDDGLPVPWTLGYSPRLPSIAHVMSPESQTQAAAGFGEPQECA